MVNKWNLWAAFSAFMLILLMSLWISKLKSENDYLNYRANILNRENLNLNLELQANRTALLTREAEKERLAKENAALTAAIKEVYTNDPAAESWAADLCPDSLLCLLD